MNGLNLQTLISLLMAAVVGYLVYQIAQPFFVPLAWAAVLVIFFWPVHRRLRRLIPYRNLAALVTVIAITVLLVVPVVSLAPAFVSQAISIVSIFPTEIFLPKLKMVAERYLERMPPPLGDVQDIVTEVSRRARSILAQESARLAGNVARFIFNLFMMLLAMFYLFRDGDSLVRVIREIMPMGYERRDRMLGGMVEMVQVTISSSFVVAAVQGFFGGLAFWVLGMASPIFWGVVMGLMAFLPIVGPWLIWGPAAIGLFLGDQTGKAIALLILGFVVVSGADNVLRPMLIAGRSQLNGLLVFVSVLGGIKTLGFLGVVLGPLVVATAVGLLKGYRESLRAQRGTALTPEHA